MYSRIETVTPAVASEYLKKNYKNRAIRQNVVRRYAADMKNGDWQLSPQGISFFENGDLADGQHRLEAVILADCAVDFFITYDVPKDCTIQDRGAKRTTSDVLRMEGITSYAASTNAVSLANCLFNIAGKTVVSEGTLKKFIIDNEKLICDALSVSNNKVNGMQLTRKSQVSAAVFCALYCGLSEKNLSDFIKVVNSGFTESVNEQAAIVLRNYLIQSFANKNTAERRFCFVVATNAIKDFANGIPRQKIYRADTDPAFWKHTKKNLLDRYLGK